MERTIEHVKRDIEALEINFYEGKISWGKYIIELNELEKELEALIYG